MIVSILESVKKKLGLTPEYTAFDEDIVMSVNSALSTLTQLGVGPATGFSITGAGEEWATFLGSGPAFEGVKDYVYLKTRMVFDPPTTSYMITAMEKQIAELEWRINVYYDTKPLAPIVNLEPQVWVLNPDGSFPQGAKIGEYGIDSTGELWRYEG